MHTLLSVLATLVRLLRPSRGLHTDPGNYLRELRTEARARRANRVRRYAHDVPTVASVPLVPAPRRVPDAAPLAALATLAPVPSDYVPVVDPREAEPPAAMVRGPFRHWEAQQARARVDASRLDVGVLVGIAANVERAEVTA